MVRRTATAEHQPVVGRALAVDDQVSVVGERREVVQPDVGEHGVRQRLCRHDQRVDRSHRVALAGTGNRSGEALGGHDDVRRAHRTAIGGHPARFDHSHRGLLVEGDAEPLDTGGETAHESRRVDTGAMRCVRRAQHPRGAAVLSRLGGVEQAKVRVGHAPGMGFRDVGARSFELG